MKTKNYEKLRLQVLRRDNYTCQNCLRRKKELEVHHVIPRLDGGIDSINNMFTFCKQCHGFVARKFSAFPIKKKIVIISITNYNRLKQYGQAGDSMNDALTNVFRLLDAMHCNS